TWDERLTTVTATRHLVATAGRRRLRRRQARTDPAAAAVMLQSWLDAHRPPREPAP
ncbi:MAG: Holliday junction resolvase RuvX, partial [Acidimicrobiales bacterium]